MACGCPDNKPCDSSAPCQKCKSNLSICHFFVDTFEEARKYRNSYVVVSEENTTYHIDENGSAVIVNRQPLYIGGFTPTPGKYQNQLVFDFDDDKAYIYSPTGAVKQWDLT